MTWQTPFELETSGRLCLALLHSLWQVALAAIVAGAVGRLWCKVSVEWNYIVNVVALVVSLAALPATFLVLSHELPTVLTAVPAEASDGATPVESAPTDSVAPTHVAPRVWPMLAQDIDVAATSKSHRPLVWQRFAPWLAALYAAGVAGMLVRLAAGAAGAERIRRLARPLVSGTAVDALRSIARQCNVRAVPALAQAEQIVVPTLIGIIKPTILLPASALTGLSVGELEMILAHELAHVRRRDMWVNLLQRLAEVALFFNPALWYLSRRIAELREYCCDEFVCRARSAPTAVARVDYAAALMRVVELAHANSETRRHSVATIAASGRSPSELRRRIARLLGEPLRERLGVSRGGLLFAATIALAITMAPAWLRSQTPAVEAPPSEESTAEAAQTVEPGAFPPPKTEADTIVAAARARTFGLQNVPRMSMRQASWSGTVVSMQKAAEQSIDMLLAARGQQVDEEMRGATQIAVSVAWDGAKLLVQTGTNTQAESARESTAFTQSRYWDGAEGWLGEISSQGRHIYRYAALDKLMEYFTTAEFPQWTAAGGRLPWPGPRVVMKEYDVDAELTRYRHVKAETIDGVECDVYDGPARMERVWIDKSTGLVKATCRQYVHESLPNYDTDLVREVVGRTFADSGEYRTWLKSQPAEVQAKVFAHWNAVHWPGSEPGNLCVFSDYREIAPGVHWPMHCERTVVHPAGGDRFKYYRTEASITDVTEDFSLAELASGALPRAGDAVTDRRSEPFIDYQWTASLKESELETVRQAKLETKRKADAEERRINETPIDSIADAVGILTEGPKTEPTKVWARAIKYLVDHKEEALPAVIAKLDVETRDHPISKLAFALRAIGDRRAVPALIRALPRTLLPSRSDFGLVVDDPQLGPFMQQHDQNGKPRGRSEVFAHGWPFDYGRAFREVSSALHRLTGKDFGEMDLNWVYRFDAPTQRRLQESQFHRQAQRWVAWWEANWQSQVDDPKYAAVDLPALAPTPPAPHGPAELPVGPGIKIPEVSGGWIVEPADVSKKRCFVDLDTHRQGDWPASLAPLAKIGVDSPALLAWAREEGFDLVCVSHTPAGDSEPLYCLKPLDMRTWKMSSEEHRRLAADGAGGYPLEHPVQMMIPQREVKRPYDHRFGGDSFLYVTREGTAGILRMTAQVTDTDSPVGAMYSRDDQFSPVGFFRGAKIGFEPLIVSETPGAQSPAQDLAPTSRSSAPAARESEYHELKVLVVDAEGRPIPGTKVFQNHVYVPSATPVREKRTRIKNHNYSTDDAGAAIVTWSGKSVDLRLWVTKPGYAPLHAMWAKDIQADGNQVPAEFRVVLPKGTRIGGVVRNERGEPVKGAKVEIFNAAAMAGAVTPAVPLATPVRPVPVLWLAEEDTAIVTDGEGRWVATNVPDDASLKIDPGVDGPRLPRRYFDPPLRVRVSHDDFSTFDGSKDAETKGNPTLAQLRSEEAVVVLLAKDSAVQIGPVLRGRVTDDRGQPIPGVRVVAYGGVATRFRGQEATTDDAGEYRFDPLKTGARMMRDNGPQKYSTGLIFEHESFVPADGESWRDVEVPIVPGHVETFDLAMTRGGKASGGVTDAKTGQPMSKLGLRIHNGFLNGHRDGAFMAYMTTDAAGRFATQPLFPGRYVVDINDNDFEGSDGYRRIGVTTIRADETTELQLTTDELPTLADPFEITGTAVGDDGKSMVYGGVGLRIVGGKAKLRTRGGGIDGRSVFGLSFGPIERTEVSESAPYGVGTYDVELFAGNERLGYELVQRSPAEPLRITDDPKQPELKDGVRYIRPNQPMKFQLILATRKARNSDEDENEQ